MDASGGSTTAFDGARRAATEARLSGLLEWYGRHARWDAWSYRGLKVVTITAAAAISVLATADVPALAIAALGAVVVVLEGLQQLFQFHTNAITFATAKEILKREKALYDARAGAYAPDSGRDPDRVLAERIEEVAAKDLEAWTEAQRPRDEP